MGAVIASSAWALVLAAVILETQRHLQPAEVVGAAILHATPVGLLAWRGHFGRRTWDVPSTGATCMLFWMTGVIPPTVGFPSPGGLGHASPDAIAIGRWATVAWFWFFSVGLGQHCPGERHRPPLDAARVLASVAPLIPIWSVAVFVARDADMISRWGERVSLDVGGWRFALVLVFNALTPAMVPLAVLLMCRGKRVTRTAAAVLLGCALVVLFAMASRRLWIIAVALSVLVFRACRPGRLNWRVLLTAAAVAYLGVGPVQWAYRRAVMHGGHSDEVVVAATAVADYATDEGVRRKSSEMSSSNLEQRLDSAMPLFVVIDHNYRRGPNLSPSMLTGIVRLVPSMAWPSKNAVADGLEIERQLHRVPGMAAVDLGVNPITEFVFQLGLFVGTAAGLLYGGLGRLLNRLLERAVDDPASCMLWSVVAASAFYFDAGTEIVFGSLRDGLLVYVLVRAARRFLLGPSYAAPRGRPLFTVGRGRANHRSMRRSSPDPNAG